MRLQRLYRDQTKAAELLESRPESRQELDTELFQSLKETLPQMKIGQTTYYFVEGDRRLNEEQLLVYSGELNLQYAKWRALQSLPDAIRDLAAAQQEQGLVSETEGGRIVRWDPTSTVSYCVMKRCFGIGPQATQRYNAVVAEFKEAITAWTSIEGTLPPNFVHKIELDNSPLSRTPDGVTFAVWSIDLPRSVIASAFFPNDPQED